MDQSGACWFIVECRWGPTHAPASCRMRAAQKAIIPDSIVVSVRYQTHDDRLRNDDNILKDIFEPWLPLLSHLPSRIDNSITLPQMSSKQISPFLRSWYKWKALRLPWRKRFLVGESTAFVDNFISNSRHDNRLHANFDFFLLSLPIQALIFKATHTGNSVRPAATLSQASPSAGAVSCSTRTTHTMARSKFHHNGTSGCATCASVRPLSKSSTPRCSARPA